MNLLRFWQLTLRSVKSILAWMDNRASVSSETCNARYRVPCKYIRCTVMYIRCCVVWRRLTWAVNSVCLCQRECEPLSPRHSAISTHTHTHTLGTMPSIPWSVRRMVCNGAEDATAATNDVHRYSKHQQRLWQHACCWWMNQWFDRSTINLQFVNILVNNNKKKTC